MSVELILLLFSLVLLFPKGVHLVRGNHESRSYNIFHEQHELDTVDEKQINVSFITDMKRKFGWSIEQKETTKRLIGNIHAVFDWLPIGVVVNNNILVSHGGFPNKEGYIQKINEKKLRGSDIVFDNVCARNDAYYMVWSDALPDDSMKPRLGGIVMEISQFQRYMRLNRIKLHLRSHQVALQGVHHNNAYDFVHDGIERKMLTVFSAPKYCNLYNNVGGYVVITGDEVKYFQFSGVHYSEDDDTKNDDDTQYQTVDSDAKYLDVGLLTKEQHLLIEQAIDDYEQNLDNFGI
jgi:diadenosine tetraphosphatase ApaH/serine/threonine PP2A family protein phosphatase